MHTAHDGIVSSVKFVLIYIGLLQVPYMHHLMILDHRILELSDLKLGVWVLGENFLKCLERFICIWISPISKMVQRYKADAREFVIPNHRSLLSSQHGCRSYQHARIQQAGGHPKGSYLTYLSVYYRYVCSALEHSSSSLLHTPIIST